LWDGGTNKGNHDDRGGCHTNIHSRKRGDNWTPHRRETKTAAVQLPLPCCRAARRRHPAAVLPPLPDPEAGDPRPLTSASQANKHKRAYFFNNAPFNAYHLPEMLLFMLINVAKS
jgi:hypothetical protein